jgi:malate synthase
VLGAEMARIREDVGDEVWDAGRPDDTREIFERISLAEDFPEFLTLIAYDKVD